MHIPVTVWPRAARQPPDSRQSRRLCCAGVWSASLPLAASRGAVACAARPHRRARGGRAPRRRRARPRRDISIKLAREVIKEAAKEGHLGNLEAERVLEKGGDEALEAWIGEHQYVPGYRPLVHLPTGVLE
jgi:hypothetical protein